MDQATRGPLADIPRTPFIEIVRSIRAAIDNRRSLSMVRVGSGEGTAIHHPKQGETELSQEYLMWFGYVPDQPVLDFFRDQLSAAFEHADILGLPTEHQLTVSPRYIRAIEGLKERGLPRPDQMVGDAGLHWYLQFSGALIMLLTNRRVVGVVGPRSVEPLLRDELNIQEIISWRTPGQHAFRSSDERHWPETFDRIMAELRVPEPGTPFLVGAGLLGKLYCRRIKELGGVALDIGSVLDGWAGVGSRMRIAKRPEVFSLPYIKQRLEENAMQQLEEICLEVDLPRMS